MVKEKHQHNHVVKNLQLAFALNLGFAVFELIGGLWSNSLSILAGALHDLGDSATIGVSWFLENVSRREKDQRYSYGYRRFSLLGAVISAIVLITGAIFVVIEAIPRLVHPEQSNARGMIIFAIIGISVNAIAVMRMRGEKNMNARMISWHLLDDVLGWGAILLMSLVLLFADIRILDPIFSLIITAFVLFNVIKNLKKTLSLFLQAVPEDVDIQSIENAIQQAQKVKDVHHTHLWSLDGEHNVLTTHVVLEQGASRKEIRDIKCLVQDLVPQYDLEHTTIEFEYLDEDCSMNHLRGKEKNHG